jgi:alpha-2-macroglobulin
VQLRRAWAFAATLAALLAAGCVTRPPGPQPLATVAPLPSPPAQPLIASVAPVGRTDSLAQLRIRFSDDLIPLERLESPDETAILDHFSLQPALPGRFRFLTPRMIGFEADRAWPGATRVRVQIAKGVHGLHRGSLDADVAWTFQTAGIALGDLPNDNDTPSDLTPKISLRSNLALDRASLEAHAFARPGGDRTGEVRLVVPPDTARPSGSPVATPTAAPDEAFDPTNSSWQYVMVPATPLAKGTKYEIVFEPGILPRDGNLASEKSFAGHLFTYEALRFVNVDWSQPGRFTSGDPQLRFTTPPDAKAVAALRLSPAPPQGSTPFAVFDTAIGINATLLAPNTDYTVDIAPELRDTFGQTLGSAQRATFRTGDLRPDVWATSGVNLFPASKDVRLNVVAVNAPQGVRAIFKPLAPADVVLHPDPSGAPDRGDVLPAATSWPPFDAGGQRNVERTIEIPLRAKLGAPAGALAYGVSSQFDTKPPVVDGAGVVELTDLGVFSQLFPDAALVRVHRIADGTPVAGARVEIFPAQASREQKVPPVACASGTTDATGTARLGGAAYAGCTASDPGTNDAPSFVTIVRNGSDWTYVRNDSYAGAYAGDFFNGWSSGLPIQRGTIFSDRNLYQPGETAELTAVGWFLVDGVLQRGTAPSYGLTIDYPDGSKHDLGRRALDPFALASFPVALPKDAPLGNYAVHAQAGNGEQLDGYFRVAQFKPPNFKVDLALDRAVAARGGTVIGTATNAYLFGAPLTGATTAFTVTRSPADFTPKGRDGYVFGRHWFWPEQQPDAATDVLQTSVTVDDAGKSAVTVPVAADLPYPMSYEVDADTTDASNVAVGASKIFTALPTETVIGLKADDVGTAGTPLGVAVIATDPSGAGRAGTSVHLELQLANYADATQIVEGAEQTVQSVSYQTVASADVTTGDAPATAKMTPAKPGSYRIRANVAGAKDDAGETDVQVYVGGSGAAAWFAQDPNQLTVKLDRATYKPGDVATVLVQSPFPSAELHVAVVRHGVLWETTQVVTSAAPTVRFTIAPQMLPNAAVQAFLVRRGPPPASDPAQGGNALARVGFAPFDVALDGKYVTATVSAGSAVLAPGATQTVRFHLADAAHRPVQGEAALMVVNDAVLQLTGYRPPDLVKLVYAEQPISTRYADNRSALVLTTPSRPVEKGWGFGGGLSGEEADPRVRRAFKALAYFAGSLRTDANGDARVTFALPDDLTTWRVMVVSATADGRFGNGETTFRSTKPLVANPVLPQFARPGDRFDGGLAVTNGTGAQGTLHVNAALSGPLAFLVNGTPAPTTTLDAPLDRITKAYRFSIVATGVGNGTATIKIHGAGAGDAFAIPLPVNDLDVVEAVAQTGTTQDRAAVPLEVAAGTPRDSGGLDVALASSLIPEITVAAQAALLGDDRLALSSASRLAVAADLVTLATRDGDDASAARTRAAKDVATLASLQRTDGGFAPYWQADASDPWDSLPAFAALARAHAASIAVPAAMLAGAHTYAARVLADPTAHAKWCTSVDCKAELRLAALDALAASGDRSTAFLADIDDRRAALTFADRARLARLLTAAPGFGTRAASLAKTIDEQLYATARGAVVNLPARYRWSDGPVVAQAQALRLELARNADGETIDRLTRSLLALRRNGSFGCACENAAALDALVDLAAREQPANFTATASLGGRTLLSQRFSGPRAAERSTTVAMRDLPAGRSDLALAKDGSGTLHYAVTYRYRVDGPAPGRLNGLRITRIVRPANGATVLATLGLSLPSGPLELAAAHVYDVELQIVSDHPVERVLIADPLPAGLEAVDTSFATTSGALHVPAASWAIGDQQIRSDRITAYADRLDAGIYRLHYLARTVTPGTFAWPGADVHLADRPDEFGRSAAGIVIVK